MVEYTPLAPAVTLGPDQVGALHAEQSEDGLAEVAVERHPADGLDDLAQRGETVIGVGPPGARLEIDAQAASVDPGWWRLLPVARRCGERRAGH
jgi:hypothetical protein